MKKITLLIISFFAWNSQASWLFEPGLGVNIGTLEYDKLAGLDTSSAAFQVVNGGATVFGDAFGGQVLNLRGAYGLSEMLYLGLDFSYGLSNTLALSSAFEDADVSFYRIGPTLILDPPLWLVPRFWLGFYQADFTVELLAPFADSEISGIGYKVGVGFGLLWYLSVNVEYFSTALSGDNAIGGDDEATENNVMISLSVPLSL